MELDERHAIVLASGAGHKALLDELTVTEGEASSGTAPHVHRAHVDVFYVLRGTLAFAGMRVDAGGVGYAPPGAVHWFEAGDARFLNVHAPGSAYKHAAVARRAGRRADGATIDTYDPSNGAETDPAVVAVGEGEMLASDQRTIRVKIARPELCVFEFESSPGHTGPRPHVHREHVDAFYVLEGELELFVDGQTVRAPAGTFVAAEPGVVHTFANRGHGPARFLNLHAPGMRFDEYFRRMAAGEDGREFHAAFDSYFGDD